MYTVVIYHMAAMLQYVYRALLGSKDDASVSTLPSASRQQTPLVCLHVPRAML